MHTEGGWNTQLATQKKKFDRMSLVFEIVVVAIICSALILVILAKRSAYKEQKLHSIDFPPVSILNDFYTLHEGEYITVKSNPKAGPRNMVQGIWRVEQANKTGNGLIVLRGHRSYSEGELTRVALTYTTDEFNTECKDAKLILAPRDSQSFNEAEAAFRGNDFVAKDPK